jgi:predicted RNA-binding Zn ribbon-like protein
VRVDERELDLVAVIGEEPLPRADHEGVHEQAQLVEQSVAQERPDELRTAIDDDGLAGLLLEARELLPEITADDGLGQSPNNDAVAVMRRASAGAGIEIRIERDGPKFVPAATGIDAAIGALLAITARAMIDGSWLRFKACPGRGCGWAFYDHSRNQSARWCAMKVCGDREKARAYYQRKTAHRA